MRNGDGVPNSIRTSTYDSSGNLLTQSFDGDGDGVPNRIETFTYDFNSNLLTESRDDDGDGAPNFIQTSTYNANGNLLSISSDRDGDGIPDSILTSTYDVNGNRLTESRDRDGDGIPEMIVTFTYDANGNELTQSEDNDGDGTPESIEVSTYDVNGNLLTSIRDNGIDGTPDRIDTFTYAANNNRLTTSSDRDGDGNPERVQRLLYDANGNRFNFSDFGVNVPIALLSEDFDDDGIPNKIRTATYDVSINQLTQVFDDNGDGTPDSISTSIYDDNGNLLTSFFDSNADGTSDLITTLTYDANGNQLTRTTDNGGDGTPNRIETYTYIAISTHGNSPDAINDTTSTTIDTPVIINVLGNDSDPDGDTLSITLLNGQPIASGQTVDTTNGSVTLQSDGQLSFSPNAGFVGNETFSYQISDGNGGEDSAQVQVSVNDTVDPKTGFIGNRVFFDENKNGVMDRSEGGFGGVRVTLTSAGQDGVVGTNDDVTVGTQLTGNNGFYGFGNLAAGNYQISFNDLANGLALTTVNVGNNDTRDSDADPISGMTDVMTLAADEFNSTIDAGVVLQASEDPKSGFIGNRVFFDENANGVLDSNEGGFRGVRVTLNGAGQDGQFGTDDDIQRSQTISNDGGYYGFSNLAAGDYKVTFSEIAPGFSLTNANVGSNDARDSDADPLSGITDVITLAPAEFNANVDAGVVTQQGGSKNEILGTEQANWPLKGTDGDDSIFGLGGNDRLEGLEGNRQVVK